LRLGARAARMARARAGALARPPRRSGVHAPLRHRGERLVGGLLLPKIARQDGGILAVTELPGPRDERPVARDLVMLDRLRGRNDADVEHGLVLDLAHEVAAFLDDAVDGGALRAARLLAVQCEDLLQPFDLLLGLSQMLLQTA